MKKLLLLTVFTLCSLVSNAQKQKTYFYDGIELHKVKGWTILPSKDAGVTTLTCVRIPYQMIIKKQGLPQDFNAESYLEGLIAQILEANLMVSKKNPKIKNVEVIAEGYVNNIPTKYVDIIYTKKFSNRIYVFEAHNQLFVIQCRGEDKIDKIMKIFDPILSKFTYNPESSPYGNLL